MVLKIYVAFRIVFGPGELNGTDVTLRNMVYLSSLPHSKISVCIFDASFNDLCLSKIVNLVVNLVFGGSVID